MAIPIIYVFTGWEPYLELSVTHARKFNPDSPIYHVTVPGSRVATGAKALMVNEFSEMADRFKPLYRHMSVNTEAFELFCIQRWMVAKEIMEKLDLKEAVLMDGDVLIWSDMTKVAPLYASHGMTWTEPDQPGTVFVADVDVLRKLCDFMYQEYATEAGLAELKREYDGMVSAGLPGAISDMKLLKLFKAKYSELVGDNSQIINGGRFDHNMFESDGYKMNLGLKQFVWKDGLPYGQKLDDGSLVFFHSMHFVGRSKGYMGVYSTGKNLSAATKIQSIPAWIRARIPAVIRKVKDAIQRRKK